MKRIQQRLQNMDTPAKWIFYGDSITHGCVHTWGLRDYPQLFAERVRCELGRPRDIVINSAISGNTTRQLLQEYDWRVGQFAPNVVFLMIGMNDCGNNDLSLPEFKANLQTLADRLKDDNADLVLQTTCPILPGSTPEREPHFHAYMDAIRELAASANLPLIDHTQHWQEKGPAEFYYWMSNAFHPNAYGHRAFAFELFRALDIFDSTSPTCRLFLP